MVLNQIFVFLLIFIAHIAHCRNGFAHITKGGDEAYAELIQRPRLGQPQPRTKPEPEPRSWLPADLLKEVHDHLPVDWTMKLQPIEKIMLNEYFAPHSKTRRKQASGWLMNNLDLLVFDDLCRLTRSVWLGDDPDLRETVFDKTEAILSKAVPELLDLNGTYGVIHTKSPKITVSDLLNVTNRRIDSSVVTKLVGEFDKLFELDRTLLEQNMAYIKFSSEQFVKLINSDVTGLTDDQLVVYSSILRVINNFLWTSERQVVDEIIPELRTSALLATKDLIDLDQVYHMAWRIFPSTRSFILGVYLHLFPKKISDPRQNKDFQKIFEEYLMEQQPSDIAKRILGTVAGTTFEGEETPRVEGIQLQFPPTFPGHPEGADKDLFEQMLRWYSMRVLFDLKSLANYQDYYEAIIIKELQFSPEELNPRSVCRIDDLLTFINSNRFEGERLYLRGFSAKKQDVQKAFIRSLITKATRLIVDLKKTHILDCWPIGNTFELRPKTQDAINRGW